jgi:small subunit ribosomal protein S3
VGHKVHPNAFRLGVYRPWEATWFADRKDYTKLLHEDLSMRQLILRRLRNAGIAKIETERSSSTTNAQMTITIHTAKPGIVIGKGGASVDLLREDLEKKFGNRVRISIQEIKQPELDAQLVAENIASQIERRISHRRAMKQAILRTMRAGAKGVRIALAGRLRGSEMARREWDREGRVPLHTLRADIRFGRATAKTTFGVIGVKCWIYRDLYAPKRRGGEVPEEAAGAVALERRPDRRPAPAGAPGEGGGPRPAQGPPRGDRPRDDRGDRPRDDRSGGGPRRPPRGGPGPGGPGGPGQAGRPRPGGPGSGGPGGPGDAARPRPPRGPVGERPASAPPPRPRPERGSAPQERRPEQGGEQRSGEQRTGDASS